MTAQPHRDGFALLSPASGSAAQSGSSSAVTVKEHPQGPTQMPCMAPAHPTPYDWAGALEEQTWPFCS